MRGACAAAVGGSGAAARGPAGGGRERGGASGALVEGAMRVHNQQTSRGLGVTRRRERISVCRVPIVHLDDAGELACRWTWLIMLMEKDDERTGTALEVARRGGRREVEHQRALAGRGGRPHRLAGAMVCVVSSQQSDCFGRADSGGGGQTVPWNSIHGLRAVKPAAWVSAFKSRELPALSIRCVVGDRRCLQLKTLQSEM